MGGDYEAALAGYDHFYEHALETDKSYYGVRLSYCLDEWAALGEKYPPAKARLEEKAANALALLDKTGDPERFHDYQAICHFLKCPEKAVDKFLAINDSDEKLAQAVFRFIRDDLVAAEKWDVCSAHLPQPEKLYAEFLNAFDGAMRINREREEADELLSFTKNWFANNVATLLLILKNTDRDAEAEIIYEQVSLDLLSRGSPELIDDIDDQISV